VHGDHNPKLRGLLEVFRALRAELEPHLDEEERVVFPALVAEVPDRAALAAVHEDHLRVADALARLRVLGDDFEPPSWACNSYRTLLRELAHLESDTMVHVHAEEHVLMPRFIARSA
jgi:regulator of cell morphogenesis and NO signaling